MPEEAMSYRDLDEARAAAERLAEERALDAVGREE
jgi:hypothetical protein